MLHTGANQTEAGDEGGFAGGWEFAGDGKHSAPFESLLKHGSVSWLENVEGKQVVRKEHGLR
ncbi:MAG: hypothetical protein ABR82_03605 [Verrucomicrobia subdivision 6 bacterium BACL9 MAG-120507-bin52]|uniref:Uncharacterized protein n=1 Tax=Verrucomicrobia subdivision 6 bacterium BACL9 MAG-120507-bin52 TaxID=1655590 RepID=A0A0R2RIV1_9BACT|nr:MAG: hypothetical protein ABR82_03605 [Verrucomicrobia subdivision 6 bacterium BACL9 MAG-120507-bin52]